MRLCVMEFGLVWFIFREGLETVVEILNPLKLMANSWEPIFHSLFEAYMICC